MDTALLRTLVEVGEHGSVTAAAMRLGYTQSAVSRQVAVLEEALGVRLFDRRPRGMELTEHGRILLPHVEAVLARLEAARQDLAALDGLRHGRLRVGAFPTAVAVLIPRAIADFRERHPQVALSLVEGLARRQPGLLTGGEVDVAVVAASEGEPLEGGDLDLVHLYDDELLIAVSPRHRFAGRRRVRLRELAGESWIGAGPADTDGAMGPFELRLPDAPRVDFLVHEWTAKLGLVAAGLGITPVPSLAAAATRADVKLLALDRRDQRVRAIFAATPKGRTSAPATAAFLAILRRVARRLASR